MRERGGGGGGGEKRGQKTSTGFLRLSPQSRNCSDVGAHTCTSCSNFDVAPLSAFNIGGGVSIGETFD